jgi:hypothetical protein
MIWAVARPMPLPAALMTATATWSRKRMGYS